MEEPLTLALALLTGLGLAAACGFRIFVPLLVLSLAARTEIVPLAEGTYWIGTTPALISLAVATLLEIGAYYVPVIDNLLDTVATPAAALAGAVVASAVLVDVDPWLRWTLGIVGGAGAATAVHVPAAAMRIGSTAMTAGTANPVLATGEIVGASLVSGIAVLAPIAVPMIVIALIAGAIEWRRRRRR